MKDDTKDLRQRAILQSAVRVFATYGYRKTSMDDLAQGAGVSRPALYQHFRNKEDIFRRLVADYYDDAVTNVTTALATRGSAGDVMLRAFDAHGGAAAEMALTSPHGHELLDAGGAVASDIVMDGEARLHRVYSDWLASQDWDSRISLPAPASDVADTITSALKGIKKTAPDYPGYCARVATLAAMIGAALTRR